MFLFFAVAVGRSWGFQILHGHTHRMRGSGAEMHYDVTLCCWPTPQPSMLRSCSSSLFLLISLHLGVLWITCSEKTLTMEQDSECRGTTSKIHVDLNLKHKSNISKFHTSRSLRCHFSWIIERLFVTCFKLCQTKNWIKYKISSIISRNKPKTPQTNKNLWKHLTQHVLHAPTALVAELSAKL